MHLLAKYSPLGAMNHLGQILPVEKDRPVAPVALDLPCWPVIMDLKHYETLRKYSYSLIFSDKLNLHLIYVIVNKTIFFNFYLILCPVIWLTAVQIITSQRIRKHYVLTSVSIHLLDDWIKRGIKQIFFSVAVINEATTPRVTFCLFGYLPLYASE